MKQLITLFLFFFTLSVFSQGPVVEGTYLPVAGTSFKQVWDLTSTTFTIPSTGPNQVWDYSGQFQNIAGTFKDSTTLASVAPYYKYYNGVFNKFKATHHAYLRTPLNDPSDSLHNFVQINKSGMYNLGGFNKKKAYDSTLIFTDPELLVPSIASYTSSLIDTAKYIGFAKKYYYLGNYYKVQIRGRKIKALNSVGYGTLKLPSASYNNVLLAKAAVQTLDSVFVDFSNTGNYTWALNNTSNYIDYFFIRNNTFGSSYLMYMYANAANTQISYSWYSLPADFGSISGNVFEDKLETKPVKSGVAFLYRENSNFAKDDILDSSSIDSNGKYIFDSIPYGEYRIAARPTFSVPAYSLALTTYFGDSTNWIKATPIITKTLTSAGHNIHLQYYPTPIAGSSGSITGALGLDGTGTLMKVTQSNPIPGIGIVVKKNPGGESRYSVTDGYGNFSVSGLDPGNYDLFVDIPGLYMAGTYSFTIAGSTVVNNLDYTVGSYSIHPNSSITTNLNTQTIFSTDLLNAYPNPYSSSTTISLNLTENTKVSLEVYNLLGEKISTLDDSQKQVGNYKYNFSAKSLNYPSGIYIIKLKSGDKTNVLKVIEQ